MFKNSNKNLTVGRRSFIINLIKTKTFIKRIAVSRGVAKEGPLKTFINFIYLIYSPQKYK